MIGFSLNVQMRVDRIEIVSHVKESVTEISGEINIYIHILIPHCNVFFSLNRQSKEIRVNPMA